MEPSVVDWRLRPDLTKIREHRVPIGKSSTDVSLVAGLRVVAA